METALPRSVAGPAFVRLLASVVQLEGAAPEAGLLEKLGQWVDWNRAVSLARALDGRVAPASAPADALDGLRAEAARVRAALAAAIADARAWDEAAVDPAGLPEPDAAAEFAGLRRRYLRLQDAIAAATGRLRGQLREALAARSPELARLGEIDAVLEGVLSPREHALLGAVPALLERAFLRLHAQAHDHPAGDADAPASPPPGDWRARFRRDLQALLQAELEVRFSPIDALLAAA